MVTINLFLTIQKSAAIISFLAAVLVVCVVVFLISTSSKEEDKTSVKHKVYKLRGRYFLLLLIAIIALLFLSLRLLPYKSFQGKADEIVTVVATQWAWKMEPGISDKSPAQFTGSNEITLPSQKLIKFLVTSADVNHNFAIYNSEGVLVGQTQAMPQYTNEMEHLFEEKGDYKVLCLEYCGIPHAYMFATIHIK